MKKRANELTPEQAAEVERLAEDCMSFCDPAETTKRVKQIGGAETAFWVKFSSLVLVRRHCVCG